MFNNKLKRMLCIAASLAMLLSVTEVLPMGGNISSAESSITVDGSKITGDTLRVGAISANNSSRLLLDYKAQNPDAYWEIMTYLFDKETGAGLSHVKIELGSDCDSSSGTEPATMRYEDEAADVTRGAGFQFAADAKKINPDISVDMLRWSEPKWVGGDSVKRYKWYKETLDAAYETYGLEFDYISADRNETRKADVEWIKYLRNRLDSEKNTPYDYSKIKIIASDEVGSPSISRYMLKDAELRDAVDVLGFHYTTWPQSEALKLKQEYGKELWYSEGASPTIEAKTGVNATYASGEQLDDTALGSGLTGINSTLEIASRILNMYCQTGSDGGGMTMYEYQPAVAAYYTGAVYVPKQIIRADSPWSGNYTVESGLWMTAHFTRFLTDNMYYVKDACYGDGKAVGDGHAIGGCTDNYITLADPSTGDYTMVFVNNTSETRSYNISVKNLAKSGGTLNEWITKGPESGEAYDANWLKNTGTVTPSNGSFKYTVEPYSMVTLTTTSGQKGYSDQKKSDYETMEDNLNLTLPYTDDFEYSDKDGGFLASRGEAPLYTTDQGGAFEVVDDGAGNNILKQKITTDIKPDDWGYTCEPTTTLGDTDWSDYCVSIDAKFDPDAVNKSHNYVGAGLRFLSSGTNRGYWIKLMPDGTYSCMNGILGCGTDSSGGIKNFDPLKWHNLKVKAVGTTVKFYIDHALVYTFESSSNTTMSGRVGIFSNYFNNTFDNLKVEEVGGSSPYVTRIDALSSGVDYSAVGWTLNSGASYKYFNRTNAIGSQGAKASFDFTGTGLSIVGQSDAADITVTVDGVKQTVNCAKTTERRSSFSIRGLEDKEHSFEVLVNSGNYTIDCYEVLSAAAQGQDNDPDDSAILEAGISANEFEAEISCGDYVYDNTEFKPDVVSVKYNGKLLTEGKDYDVGYHDNVDASQTAKVYIIGRGEFCGTQTVNFTISPADIASRCTVSNIPEKVVYTGKAFLFNDVISLTDNLIGETLEYGTDYVISYKDNTEVGTAEVTIKGRRNYSGEVVKTFKIVAANSETMTTATTKKTVVNEKKPSVSKVKKVKAKPAGKKKVKISWKKQKAVKGYIVKASLSPKFKAKKKFNTVTKKLNKNKNSIKLKLKKSGKKYYVKVCAYKTYISNGVQKTVKGKFSKNVRVKTK